MKPFERTQAFIARWMDDVATCFVAIGERMRAPERIRLVGIGKNAWRVTSQTASNAAATVLRFEHPRFVSDSPVLLAGLHVDVTMRPESIVLKDVELPERATDFLDGIVRSQIDRLTPWKPEQAIFGFTPPVRLADGQIGVQVAAMPRSAIEPFIEALAAEGALSVEISTTTEDGSSISMFRRRFDGGGIRYVRRLSFIALGAAAAVLIGAIFADTNLGADFQSRQDRIATQISRQHAALMAARNRALDPQAEAERALVKRKNETPADVVVLEALTRALPDRTYLTDMRIEKDKLQISGMTDDAPSLIRFIEQSAHFRRAVFFAPTTRSPSDTGYRFHIEAQIVPVFAGW